MPFQPYRAKRRNSGDSTRLIGCSKVTLEHDQRAQPKDALGHLQPHSQLIN